ncbi:GNAT family N-acetyltransferase [Vallitalea sp.]|jgi:ribosomal protein S18 acetylase RimI-like enzyme|uniref:GNAT family N-acetyltransferase n=1 Tax=Vallitalea sp. TaxID=1882829 RepID=UPI0025EE00CF|nr:GNAT family N-acetyltransferase [Vallitalea sp.]MCT4687247.1 GNAT family N-acetyltransferase [Vallitalea sp.]
MVEIVKAKIDDIVDIMKLINDCVNNMRANNIFQWDEHYPNQEIMLKDIEDSNLYVMKDDNSYFGIVTINEEQDKEYKTVDWKSESTGILVVHRLAVSPLGQGKGIGRSLMLFAEDLVRQKNYKSVRLDTYSGNPIALSFYKRLGYEKVGEVYFTGRELAYYCYEKIIEKS